MTTKQMDKLLTAKCPQGVLFNLRKARNIPLWHVRVYNEAECDAHGARASWIQMSVGDNPAEAVADFVHDAQRQLAYDWKQPHAGD